MALALRWVFCMDLRTDSNLCFVHRKLIGFYSRGVKCLQRGRDWFLTQGPAEIPDDFCKTVVSGTVGVGNLSLSALLARLKAFQLPWSAGLYSIVLLLWRRISKNNDSVLTHRIFRRHFNINRNECPLSQYFFLWGYLKSKVYEKKPRTTVDLKQNIREEVAAISPNMLQRVMQNFQKRLGECVDKDATSQTLYSGSECCN